MTVNRWIEGILMYDFKLRHIPAKKFGAVDGLSRRRPGEGSEDDDDEDRKWEEEVPKLRYEGPRSFPVVVEAEKELHGASRRYLVGVFDEEEEEEEPHTVEE